MNTQQKFSELNAESFTEVYNETKTALSQYILNIMQNPNTDQLHASNEYDLQHFERSFAFYKYLTVEFDYSHIKMQIRKYLQAFKSKNHITELTKNDMCHAFSPLLDDIMESSQSVIRRHENGSTHITTLKQLLIEQDCGFIFHANGFKFVTNYKALKKAQNWYHWRFWLNLFS